MNTKIIADKTADLIALLTVASSEAQEIDAKRKALENASYSLSEREKQLSAKDIHILQREREGASQKKYVDEQYQNNQVILKKLQTQKEELNTLVIQKKEIGIERLQLEADKKSLEGLLLEKERLAKERTEFEKEKAIFSKERIATQEHQKRLHLLDKRLETERERLQSLYNGV